jgi:hypothetical protein
MTEEARGRILNAVVSVGRLHLGGFLAWWAWLVIHIGFMTGFRNRFGAVASWWFAFTRDLRRERTFTGRDVGVRATSTARTPGSLFPQRRPPGRRCLPIQARRGRVRPPPAPSDARSLRAASRSPPAGPSR